MLLIPRDYQAGAVKATFDYFRKKTGNPLIVMPTGTGKSLVAALFMQECERMWKGTRIILVTHVQELIEQDHDAVFEIWPDCSLTGIYSAALKKRQDTQLMFASIQSIFRKAYDFDPFDIIIVDEAHRIPKSSIGMYHQFFRDCLVNNPKMKVIGLTATDFRLDDGCLTDGKERLFDEVCYRVELRDMIEQGYLSPLISKPSEIQPDLSRVHVKMGEYVQRELTEVMQCGVTIDALNECIQYGHDRKSWLGFAVSVDHAIECRDILMEKGIPTAVIHGGTPKDERAAIIDDFKNRRTLRCVVNCKVLTTGFNAPCIDMIFDLAPTQSTSLYIQKVGRGTRKYPGKENCLYMDFGRNIETHGPIDKVRIKKQYSAMEGEKSELSKVPSRECFQCKELVPISSRECPDCGFVFPMSDIINHEATASTKSIMHELEILEIEKIEYYIHHKMGKESLRVEYYCKGYGRFQSAVSEWVCLEHRGRARTEAEKWWTRRTDIETPGEVEDALEIARKGELDAPLALKVDSNGAFKKIISYLWKAN